jgi:hypothetical protein
MKQIVRPEYRNIQVPKEPPMNKIPIVVALIILGIIGIFAAQGSWIGQLLTHGAPNQDPLDSLTITQARAMIETQITQGLTQAGAPVKISYTLAGQPADKSSDKPLEMAIDTTLKNPAQHKAIIDPIKQYMGKARIPSLVMRDSKSHATWTYSCALTNQGTDTGQVPDTGSAEQPTQQAN